MFRDETEYRGFGIVMGEDKRLYIESQDIDPSNKGYPSLIDAKKAIDAFWPFEGEAA